MTIPYKKTVLSFCAELSPAAEAVGSVNTLVRRPDGTIFGDNTDAEGFRLTVLRSGAEIRGKKALVLGSGGASAAVSWVLRDMGARVVVVSRTGEDNYRNLSRHRDAELLVNATPVGMNPHNGQAPLDLSELPALRWVMDLVYNPRRTALLLQAEKLGIPFDDGLVMLVAQAKRSAELFSGSPIPDGRIDEITRELAREMGNIILIGMPGCGKTTVAGLLGRALGRPVVDADAEIAAEAGCSIPQLFTREGEVGFRARETAVLSRLGARSGVVLATGGGCVTRPENYAVLHQNGVIIWLRRDLDKLPISGRPLSQQTGPAELYRQRRSLYEAFADYTIDNNGPAEETLRRVLEVLSCAF